MKTNKKIRKWIKQWFGDALFRRLIKNSSQLLGGSLAQSIMGFGAVILAARGLGPEKYGVLVLVQTYALIVDNLVNFQSWQALIKYGADALESEDGQNFRRLIKFGVLLDVGSAILGMLIIVGGASTLWAWEYWSSELALMLGVYSGVVLFNLRGTPTAILRLFDQFAAFAVQKAMTGLFRLVGVIVAFAIDATVWGYLFAWVLGDVAGYVLLLILGWRELASQGYNGIFQVSLDGLTDLFSELWYYVWATNMSGSVKMIVRRLDNVVVAAVLGTAAVGLYEVAKKFSKIANRLSNPFYQAVYPELSKLWSRKKREAFVRLVLQTIGIAGLGALLIWGGVVMFGRSILMYTVGVDYVEVYPVMIWYVFAVGIEVTSFSLAPAMLAMGRPRMQFVILVIAAALYFGALTVLLFTFGLLGAGMAYVVFYTSWFLMMVGAEAWLLRRSRSATSASH